MNTYDQMPSHSRVWIYQSDRPFTESESITVNEALANFVQQWAAHGQALHAFGKLFYNHFIILMVDEGKHAASGCSIDTSVHFIKQLELQYGVNLFDRMLFAYKDNGQVRVIDRMTFAKMAAVGTIHDDTIVFNNLVSNKAELETNWQIPMSQSWHKRMVG